MRYSLIIPHYGDEKRLGRLLSTIPILRNDLEVIVVDDCSVDKEEFSRMKMRWPRVCWLSTTRNSGAGAARNVGLRHAGGEWLVFADSDDEFLPGAFDMFDKHVKQPDDLVYFFAEAQQDKSEVRSSRADRVNQLCRRALDEDSKSALEMLKLRNVVPWAKVYSRGFVEGLKIRFEETRVSNDVAFNVLAASQAQNVRIVPVVVYRVYRRAGSLTAGQDVELQLDRMAVLARLNEHLARLGKPGRMHAGSFIYHAIWQGPCVFAKVLGRSLSSGLFWPIFSHLSFREVIGFTRRWKQERNERGRV